MKPCGREVAPVGGVRRWRKRCPECAREFVGGRAARCCPPCRKKLKAWRHRTRNEVRRAKRGLFPGQKVLHVRLGRAKPTKKNRRRMRWHTCVDCPTRFFAGIRALRCVPCAEKSLRLKWKRHQRTSPRRNRGTRPNPDRFSASA